MLDIKVSKGDINQKKVLYYWYMNYDVMVFLFVCIIILIRYGRGYSMIKIQN